MSLLWPNIVKAEEQKNAVAPAIHQTKDAVIPASALNNKLDNVLGSEPQSLPDFNNRNLNAHKQQEADILSPNNT
ncbi:hypothetical protein HDU76_002339, partial [Blyttiomyces sp. JEL0837]